jgi:glutathione S-transferase
VTARLYTLGLSHPGHATRLALEYKGIEHEITTFPEGMHPLLVRLAGFRGNTIPALKLDGRRIQTSLAIARELERVAPDPPLYPADPEQRVRVEEAERWGEAELQPVARRILRWSLTEQRAVREWLARRAKLPAAGIQSRTSGPIVRRFAKASGANAERVRRDLAELPGKLDRVDALISAGTLSLERPNAATFQVGTSVRALGMFAQLDPLLAGRPCDGLARALLPEWPRSPVQLPLDWVPAATGSASSASP